MKDLENKKIMARNIKHQLERFNISKAELSRMLKVPYTTVCDWVSAKTYPRIDKIEAMSHFFGVPKAALVENEFSEENRQGYLPLYGSVCAGDGLFADDHIEEMMPIGYGQYRQEKHFALRIKGNSMEPDIKDGDIVIVRKQTTAEDNDIVIAIVNGDKGVCKRLKRYPGGMALVSSNPLYEPKYFSEEEVTGIPVRIVGKVVELKRKF